MGEYYKAVSVDCKEYASPYDYGELSKLMEHSWLRNNYVNAVVSLLFTGGRWSKKRFVWTGDYSEQKQFVKPSTAKAYAKWLKIKDPERAERCPSILEPNLYDICLNRAKLAELPFPRFGYFKSVIVPIPESATRKAYHYILNHTKKEFVNIYVCPRGKDGWILHPLPILTSDSFDGGGTYHKDNEYKGTWAYDVIEVTAEKPKGFKEIRPDFVE